MVDYDSMLQQLDSKIYAFSHESRTNHNSDITYNVCCYVLMPMMIVSLLYINKPAIIMKNTTEPDNDIDIARLIGVSLVISVAVRVILFCMVG